MEIKKSILLLTLFTGAVVCNPVSKLDLSSRNIANMVYDVSCDYCYDKSAVLDTDISIPIIDTMVPQGLTVIGDYFLVSSYDYSQKENSCIFVLNKDGEIVNTCSLNNKAHVGGIAYDEANQLVWITGQNGKINVYDASLILYGQSAFPKFSNLDIGKGLTNYKNPFLESASFLTIYNGRLFVGNFNLNDKGIVKEYFISNDENNHILTLFYIRSFSVPNKVQGLSFYTKDEIQYILFSKSYGKWASSQLEIYRYDQEIDDYTDSNLTSVSFEYPSMMEQNFILGNNIYSLYESCARPYSRGNDYDTECVTVTDVRKLVKKLEIKEDTIN